MMFPVFSCLWSSCPRQRCRLGESRPRPCRPSRSQLTRRKRACGSRRQHRAPHASQRRQAVLPVRPPGAAAREAAHARRGAPRRHRTLPRLRDVCGGAHRATGPAVEARGNTGRGAGAEVVSGAGWLVASPPNLKRGSKTRKRAAGGVDTTAASGGAASTTGGVDAAAADDVGASGGRGASTAGGVDASAAGASASGGAPSGSGSGLGDGANCGDDTARLLTELSTVLTDRRMSKAVEWRLTSAYGIAVAAFLEPVKPPYVPPPVQPPAARGTGTTRKKRNLWEAEYR